jgi:hypothetical protein
VPPLLKFENIPWVVYVTYQPVDDGFDLDQATDRIAASDLWDRVEAGEISEEEYHDSIGPERGYRPIDVYGPYTERQAEALADYLSQPEVRVKHNITTAVPSRLTRFIA